VLANALQRYGVGISVLVSAAVFAISHDTNPVMLAAFLIGVGTAVLFRKTGSVWPGLFLHATNNVVAIVMPLILASLGVS
jgi:membrane protease YdiL (CAAX protease family)